MKLAIYIFTFLGFVSLTFGQTQSPVAGVFDVARSILRNMFGGNNSPLTRILDQVLDAFQFNDWKEKVPSILEEKAKELSKRGMREFEQAMGQLDVMKEDPNTTKEDYMKVVKKLQNSSQ
ncbi:uncharacterized protein NPIL_308011 [Nephila pilipes]|uniref:Uncharacterized protein n=1 Tax=Nephila pilipes TaxID=299642 RepID=A0A8X6QYN3_NEPPI|nr:uncharacterized protein NPIL_308011 [Nephila pilipes]